jgi:signal transduction histidine kinase
MRAAETRIHLARGSELDSFLEVATRELATAVGAIRIYADLLDAQVAGDPGSSGVREIVREVREQARLVAALVNDLAVQASPQVPG